MTEHALALFETMQARSAAEMCGIVIVVWSGVGLGGALWCGVVWCGLVWCGAVLCGVVCGGVYLI